MQGYRVYVKPRDMSSAGCTHAAAAAAGRDPAGKEKNMRRHRMPSRARNPAGKEKNMRRHRMPSRARNPAGKEGGPRHA